MKTITLDVDICSRTKDNGVRLLLQEVSDLAHLKSVVG